MAEGEWVIETSETNDHWWEIADYGLGTTVINPDHVAYYRIMPDSTLMLHLRGGETIPVADPDNAHDILGATGMCACGEEAEEEDEEPPIGKIG